MLASLTDGAEFVTARDFSQELDFAVVEGRAVGPQDVVNQAFGSGLGSSSNQLHQG